MSTQLNLRDQVSAAVENIVKAAALTEVDIANTVSLIMGMSKPTKSSFEDLMIDIETLGTSSNSVIVSIAAVEFNLQTGEVGEKFYRRIDIDSCLKSGLKINAGTLKFWFDQDKESQSELFQDAKPLDIVLKALRFRISDNEYKVWGNGSRFDLGLLTDAFNACNLPLPWKHWNERDVRTLSSFNPSIKKDLPFQGVKHNPVDDCLHQIKYCHLVYKSLKIDNNSGFDER